MNRSGTIILGVCAIATMVMVRAAADNWDFSRGVPKARVRVEVQDEHHSAKSGARVAICFDVSAGPAGGTKSVENVGLTDTGGIFSVSGKTAGRVVIVVKKDAYYPNYCEYRLTDVADGKWQPWDATVTQVLRMVKNPIAMFAKHVETTMPASEQPVGYDLIVGDWIAPYGKGIHGDLLFKVTRRRLNSFMDFDASLSMTFANPMDGCRRREGNSFGGSRFVWLYNAPEEGYEGVPEMGVGYSQGNGYYRTNENAACYVRVRTVTNEQGSVVSSYYGKIPGPIAFDIRDTPTCWLQFTYYLNPTPNDRNMEFDPTRNLFTNLESLEQVTAP